MRVDDLAQGVVSRCLDPQRIGLDPRYGQPLPSVEAARVGNKGLNQEGPVRAKHRRHIPKASCLIVRCKQGEECIEGDEDERTPLVQGHVTEVAHGDGNRGAPWLAPELRDHRRRGVDAADCYTALMKRKRQPAGTYAQLERRTVTGQFRQRRDDLRITFTVKGVIELRDLIAVRRS